ncbi:MAG: MGMT family protein [Flavobacteriales bacterium]|nr:MGMT family protein [Flavobacteriales bacterium]
MSLSKTVPDTKTLLCDDNFPNFFELVHEVVKLIPEGRVTTYGAIANYLGAAKSSRMVGWAINNVGSKSDFIPAHRVVNRKGMLTGKAHFGSQNEMQILLEKEGLKIKNDAVQDFEKVFWNPMETLSL